MIELGIIALTNLLVVFMNLVGILGKLLLSGALSRGGAGGLGSLLGGASRQSGAGGLGSLLSGLTGGQSGGLQQGGAGGLLGALLGGAGGSVGGQQGGAGGMGALLGSALGQQSAGAQQPVATAEQTDQAALLIRAMVNAAKCDGSVDQQEQQKIVGKLGDIGQEEAAFIRSEMQSPLDVNGFIRSVPKGLEQQVYVLSLMTVNLDSKAEAEYLNQLAKGFGISEQASNQLHDQLGVPQLYS